LISQRIVIIIVVVVVVIVVVVVVVEVEVITAAEATATHSSSRSGSSDNNIDSDMWCVCLQTILPVDFEEAGEIRDDVSMTTSRFSGGGRSSCCWMKQQS